MSGCPIDVTRSIHFRGIVRAESKRKAREKPVERVPVDPPRENVRDFRYPPDLDVLFIAHVRGGSSYRRSFG
jgi:hypothetical protein